MGRVFEVSLQPRRVLTVDLLRLCVYRDVATARRGNRLLDIGEGTTQITRERRLEPSQLRIDAGGLCRAAKSRFTRILRRHPRAARVAPAAANGGDRIRPTPRKVDPHLGERGALLER